MYHVAFLYVMKYLLDKKTFVLCYLNELICAQNKRTACTFCRLTLNSLFVWQDPLFSFYRKAIFLQAQDWVIYCSGKREKRIPGLTGFFSVLISKKKMFFSLCTDLLLLFCSSSIQGLEANFSYNCHSYWWLISWNYIL